MCWRECFRGAQQLGAIEIRSYRSRGLEKPVLERELSEDIAAGGYRSMGAIKVGVWKSICLRESFRVI